MKVKMEYQGHVLEIHRTLGGVRFVVDGEILDMTGGKLIHHKVDQHFEAEIKEGHDKGTMVSADLKLGWVRDKVLFYYDGKLIGEKNIF